MKVISIVKTNLVLFAVVVFVTASVLAAPFAKKIPFTQPDGTEIELWGEGDEFYAVFETLDGYTVVFDPQTKAYHYAQRSADGNNLISAGMEVGKHDPAALSLAKHVRIKPEAVKKQAFEEFQRWDQAMQVSTRWKAMKGERRQAELAAEGQGGSSGLQPSPPGSTTTGTKVGLCLLIDFSDAPATVSQAEIVNFCNSDSYTGYGNNGSVKKYYLDNSNNLLTYTNVVTIYIRAPQLKTYYNDTTKGCGQQARLLITDAIAVMKALPDYNTVILPTFNALTVDGSNNAVAFNVFYAGGNGGVWTRGLWPHSWMLASPLELSSGGKKVYRYQISNIGSTLEIGTFCHENGHMLCGFPDIYDYGYDSWGGAGFFCLMDYGSWGGSPQGSNPVQICAYLKRAAGWANVTDLPGGSLTTTATVTAAPTAGYNNYYRYRKPGVSTEYFLVENRQQTGHDASIPAAGVAVWHIDELGDKDNQNLAPNTTHDNYEVTLVQADNQWDFEYNSNWGDARDLYYAGNFAPAYSNRLDNNSSPNANWWDGTSSGANFYDFSVNGTSMTFISLNYTEETGNFQVMLGPADAVSAGAQWRRTETSTWLNSGDTESGLSLGQYTVEFSDIPGWNKPANQSVTINDGQTAIALGIYIYMQNYQTGGIVGWGDNSYGQATPPADNNFIAVAAGYYHGLALKSDGSIVGWGDN
jgi:M6 family metalloprotease-like protein